MATDFDTNIAIGEYGTQWFWFNSTSDKFEYAMPLVEGGEFGGDTESTEAPELDLDYIPKLSGRTSLNDIEITANYTPAKYARLILITSQTDKQVYLEVFTDGSGFLYSGTAGRPTVGRGTPRPLTCTIAPETCDHIGNVQAVTETEYNLIKALLGLPDVADWATTYPNDYALVFDTTTIPDKRVEFFEGETPSV